MRALEATAARLYTEVMAPLVLGGPMRPGRAIGVRTARALAELQAMCEDADLEERVRLARIHQGRKLVPVDEFGPASGAEWMLAAALHNLLQCANPSLDNAWLRRAAERILGEAEAILDRVPAPAHTFEALSRHTWLARVLEIRRQDTRVSWWIGSRRFFGTKAPPRLLMWPRLRNVKTAHSTHALVDLAPLAVPRERLMLTLEKLLERTPLTALATCTRSAPPFVWGATTLALVATRAGRALATRALARLPLFEADAALGRALRQVLARSPESATAAVALLADRAVAHAQSQAVVGRGPLDLPTTAADSASPRDAAFARHIGVAAAKRAIAAPNSPWPEAERQRLLALL